MRAVWQIASTLLTLATPTLTSPLTVRATPNCVQGVMVIAARGTDSSWHNANQTNPNYASIGGLQTIGNAVVKAVGKGSYVAAVPYAASLDDYFTSLANGVTAVQGMIKNYTDQCKGKVTPRVVLLGYSQGAQVMSQALVGGNGQAGLGSAYVKTVVAGAIFADPSFLPGYSPLDAGSNTNRSGLIAMSGDAATQLNSVYGKILRSYCQYGDYFCARGSGSDAMQIHGAAVQTYTNAAEHFLLPIVKKFA